MSGTLPFLDWIRHWRTLSQFKISSDDVVLEVGPGHAPYDCADVLLDRYIEYDEERGGPIALDHRPLLQGDLTSLPFMTNTFDFVIASHVIEHVEKPEPASLELSRVAQRGYVECPTLFWELFRPTREYHKWVILPIDNKLVFYRKDDVSLPPFGTLFERNELMASSKFLSLFFDQYRDLFLVRHVWEDDIEVIVGPTEDDLVRFFEGPYNEEMIDRVMPSPPKSHLRTAFIRTAKQFIKSIFTPK